MKVSLNGMLLFFPKLTQYHSLLPKNLSLLFFSTFSRLPQSIISYALRFEIEPFLRLSSLSFLTITHAKHNGESL
jgi:hypothetical protein